MSRFRGRGALGRCHPDLENTPVVVSLLVCITPDGLCRHDGLAQEQLRIRPQLPIPPGAERDYSPPGSLSRIGAVYVIEHAARVYSTTTT